MADYYVDASTGSDSNAGTSGAPFLTIQKAVDSCTGSAGNNIYLSNVATFVQSSVVNWTTYSATTSRVARLVFRAWDNGGSKVISHPAGDIVCAEIDGNDAVANFYASTDKPAYMSFYGIKGFDFTGSFNIGANYQNHYSCEYYGCGGTEQINISSYGRFINCISRNPNSGTRCLTAGLATTIQGCLFYGGAGGQPAVAITGDYCNFVGNTVRDCTGATFGNFWMSGHYGVAAFNTFIGTSTSNVEGVQFSGSDDWTFVSNIVANHSGTGARGLKFSGSTPQSYWGHNMIYNNTIDDTIQATIDNSSTDVTESSDPFEDASSDDYRVVSGANAYEAGWPDMS